MGFVPGKATELRKSGMVGQIIHPSPHHFSPDSRRKCKVNESIASQLRFAVILAQHTAPLPLSPFPQHPLPLLKQNMHVPTTWDDCLPILIQPR